MSWIRESTLSWFQYLAVKILKTGHVPKHVAFIMDGNRRYAKKTNIEKLMGHTRGFDKLAETLQWCMDLGIPEVTVYAFSIENYKRSKDEVDALMELARQKFQRLLDERAKLMEHSVCVRVIGNLSLVPEDIRKLIAEVLLITENNNKAFLNIAFAYTSTDEITTSVKDILEGVKYNEILPEDINEDLVSKCLYTHNSPDPELLIRTSGEVRFSDFLMWQNSNSCIYFASVLWPEFNVWDLLSAVFYYQRCYADIRKLNQLKTTELVAHNARTSSYVNKVQTERRNMYEKMRIQAVQS